MVKVKREVVSRKWEEQSWKGGSMEEMGRTKLDGRKYGGNGKNKVGWEEVWRKWEEQVGWKAGWIDVI